MFHPVLTSDDFGKSHSDALVQFCVFAVEITAELTTLGFLKLPFYTPPNGWHIFSDYFNLVAAVCC